MNIKILSACCDSVKGALEGILKEMKVTATIEIVDDMKKIMAYGVIRTPALVINEKVKFAGRIPSKKEIMRYIREEM